MTTSAQLRSGKGAADENFPVASWIIQRRHRRVILAFYEFVRVADDIADHCKAVLEGRTPPQQLIDVVNRSCAGSVAGGR